MTRCWIFNGLVGAALLIPVELGCLRGLSLPLVCTVTSLLLGLGMLCGAILGMQEAVVMHLGLGPWQAAAVRAVAAVLPLALVSRTLFDGGFASTLAIAPTAPYWMPLGGFVCLMLALRLAHPWVMTSRRRRVAAALLVALLVLLEWANRTLYPSEYRDVHALLVLASVVTSALAVHLGARRLRRVAPARKHSLGMVAAAMVLSTGCALGLRYGLHNEQVRWALATSRTHSRQIARVLRVVGEAASEEEAGRAAAQEGQACQGTASDDPSGACAAPDESCCPPEATNWMQAQAVQALLRQGRTQHLLLLSVDALRADVLAAPDAEREFPHLIGLLRSARHFRRAFAPSAGTDVSLASLLTGNINPFVPVDQTLIEGAAAAGRRTHAVLPHEVLRWAGQTLLTRGLHSFDRVITDPLQQDVGSHTTSSATTDLGLAFLDQHAAELAHRPFWLWLHYFDVHEHDQIEKDDPALHRVLGGRPHGRAQKYRALVKVVDQEIGRLLAALQDRGLWERTMVVLLSDHGESLGEDPRFPDNHGHYVYNALVHVPVAIRLPGVGPAMVDEPISLIDLTPTILSLIGAPPGQAGDGRSLLPYLVDEPPPGAPPRRPIVMNESEQYALLLWPHKLLVRPADRLVELYDLEADFQERHDLSGTHGHKVRELKRLYQRQPRVPMDRSARARQLRELAAQPPPRR
ncbi:MAG: sulfatase [Myxococcota bacterium]|nr:sulfatase [Myxococcota bacterium]